MANKEPSNQNETLGSSVITAEEIAELTKEIRETNRQREELLDNSKALTTAVVKLQKSDLRRGRHTKLLAVALFFDVAFTIGFALLFQNAKETNDKTKETADKVAASQYEACLSGNESRALQIKLWDFVLSFPPPPGQTPEQLKAREESSVKFKTFLHKTYAPKDCNKIPT